MTPYNEVEPADAPEKWATTFQSGRSLASRAQYASTEDLPAPACPASTSTGTHLAEPVERHAELLGDCWPELIAQLSCATTEEELSTSRSM